ncbi:hypothetical protein P3T18_002857 [Paraburkholderia sp. GAS199]|uniref:hypothetical protein n=1 Tax=Paraburkholderia sp. GAS199 TaxID=3035126 RepID=UPI003D247389
MKTEGKYMPVKFSELFSRAISEWPVEIDLRSLSPSVSGSGRYSIEGLYDMADELEGRYIGSPEETIMRNLHTALYEVLLGVAAYVVRIKLVDLRAEEVQLRLERRLREYLAAPEDCRPQDIELCERYFAENGRK